MARPKAAKFYVYVLIDPTNGRVFYAGKGAVGSWGRRGRLRTLVGEAKRGRSGPKYDTIRSILSQDALPIFTKVFETDDEEAAFSREKAVIAEIGLDLLDNIAIGGRGNGDEHWTRTNPERVLRGDDHPARTNSSHAAFMKTLQPSRDQRARGERHGQTKLSDAQIDEMKTRFAAGGVTARQLAVDYEVSATHVGRILKARNRSGEAVLTKRHGNAKLSAEDRNAIKVQLKAGEKGNAIARTFGVSAALVSLIRKKEELEIEIIPAP